MQAVSMVLTPLIMSGADMLFSTLKGDSYSKEAERHNLKMEQLESDRVKWDQNYANEEREYTRKRQQRADAKEDGVEDRSVLDQLLLQKDQIKGQLRTEVDKYRRRTHTTSLPI